MYREPDVYESSSSASSEFSTGNKNEDCQTDTSVLPQETGHELQSDQLDNPHFVVEESGMCHTATTNDGTKYNILAWRFVYYLIIDVSEADCVSFSMQGTC